MNPISVRAHGAPVLQARIRTVAEDFFVEELPAFAASGAGEHLLLTVEKRGMNTPFAAQRIARWAGVPVSAVGFAGMKDRHAVTRQRFSVWLPKRVAPPLEALQSDDLRVLDHVWHSRKLPRGALAGNRFVLVLRGVQGASEAIEARLRAIAAQGVPNAFGRQRFGRDGGNVAAALAMFAGQRVRRETRTLLLSAARSALFNQVLAARVAAGSWATALEGEVFMLDGSHSVFGPEPLTPALQSRLAAFDIHPTGPLWGAAWRRRGRSNWRRWPTRMPCGCVPGWSRPGCGRNGVRSGCVRSRWTGPGCRPTPWCCASFCRPAAMPPPCSMSWGRSRMPRPPPGRRPTESRRRPASAGVQQHQNRPGAALRGWRGMKRQHVGALTQQTVDQILQYRQAVFRVPALAVNDADAVQPVAAAITQELAQQGFGGLYRQAVQVQLLLRGIVAARQFFQDARGNVIASVAERIPSVQRAGEHLPELGAGLVLVASGHACRRTWSGWGGRRRRWRKHPHLAAVSPDCSAEQRGIVGRGGLGGRGVGRSFAHVTRVPRSGGGIRYHHRMSYVWLS